MMKFRKYLRQIDLTGKVLSAILLLFAIAGRLLEIPIFDYIPILFVDILLLVTEVFILFLLYLAFTEKIVPYQGRLAVRKEKDLFSALYVVGLVIAAIGLLIYFVSLLLL